MEEREKISRPDLIETNAAAPPYRKKEKAGRTLPGVIRH
jgi:hypothetical protein